MPPRKPLCKPNSVYVRAFSLTQLSTGYYGIRPHIISTADATADTLLTRPSRTSGCKTSQLPRAYACSGVGHPARGGPTGCQNARSRTRAAGSGNDLAAVDEAKCPNCARERPSCRSVRILRLGYSRTVGVRTSCPRTGGEVHGSASLINRELRTKRVLGDSPVKFQDRSFGRCITPRDVVALSATAPHRSVGKEYKRCSFYTSDSESALSKWHRSLWRNTCECDRIHKIRTTGGA